MWLEQEDCMDWNGLIVEISMTVHGGSKTSQKNGNRNEENGKKTVPRSQVLFIEYSLVLYEITYVR